MIFAVFENETTLQMASYEMASDDSVVQVFVSVRNSEGQAASTLDGKRGTNKTSEAPPSKERILMRPTKELFLKGGNTSTFVETSGDEPQRLIQE